MSLVGYFKSSGSEALLMKGVEFDKNGKYPEALANYQAGIERLMTVLKGMLPQFLIFSRNVVLLI